MQRRLGRFAVLLTGTASLGTFGIAALAGLASATPTNVCDHGTNGGGNLGDPGDGQNHHKSRTVWGTAAIPGTPATKPPTVRTLPDRAR